MPRNVRNFWLEGDIDGNRAAVSGGPQSKGGGFSLRIKQRHRGGIVEAMTVTGWVMADGSLALEAESGTGAPLVTTDKQGSAVSIRVTTERD